MRKFIKFLIIVFFIMVPLNVFASNIYLLDNCSFILGDLNDSTSTAYLLNQIFDIFKFAAPVLVIVFTTVDYVKALTNQNKEDIVKSSKRLIKRLLLAAVLFSAPTIINFLFRVLGWTGTCGIG